MTKENSWMYQEILEALNSLIDNSIKEEDSLQRLMNLKKHITKRENAFDIESLLYSGIVIEALDTDTLRDTRILNTLRNQLQGKEMLWKSYLLRHDFSALLLDEYLVAYQLICILVDSYGRQIDKFEYQEINVEEYDKQLEQLYLSSQEMIAPRTIAELVVSQASFTLLNLPNPPSATFDIQGDSASFSTLYSPQGVEDVHMHLHYISGLIRKLQGKESLYVDICMLSASHVLNLR